MLPHGQLSEPAGRRQARRPLSSADPAVWESRCNRVAWILGAAFQFPVHVRHPLICLAPPPAVPLTGKIQSPALRLVFCSVAEHVVAPFKPVVPPALAHATAPLAAVASAALVRFATAPARSRPRMIFGVPPSARTVISTSVDAADTKY